MFILIGVLFLLVIIVAAVIYVKNNYNEDIKVVCITAIVFSVFIFFGVLAFLTANLATIGTCHTIDSKITMCQEENAIIEEKISTAVEIYLKHEETTLSNIKPEDAIFIATNYPELKSDALISSQINTYIKNTAEIKILKEEKINISKAKWWVYFGK